MLAVERLPFRCPTDCVGIHTEVIDDEYKYSLPKRGSPLKGLERIVPVLGLLWQRQALCLQER
jgi:hypothetical protein